MFNWLMPEEYLDGLCYSLVFVHQGDLRLRITGSGTIRSPNKSPPWDQCRNELCEIWIDEGVTEISARAFTDLPNLKSIWLPGTMTHIGASAFAGCPQLQEVAYCGPFRQLVGIEISEDAFPAWFYELLKEE